MQNINREIKEKDRRRKTVMRKELIMGTGQVKEGTGEWKGKYEYKKISDWWITEKCASNTDRHDGKMWKTEVKTEWPRWRGGGGGYEEKEENIWRKHWRKWNRKEGKGKTIRNIGDKMDILEKIGKGGEIH